MFLLIYVLGVAALAGVATMIIAIPIQGKIVRKISEFHQQITKISDERMKKINELLQGMTSS